MAKSSIEWTDVVWNPITGCTKVSPGCRNCYAERMAPRLKGRFGYDRENPFKPTYHTDKLDEPRKWKTPQRVFVDSMGDLFHEDIDFYHILVVFYRMATYDRHTYLVLTKREQRMLEFFEYWYHHIDWCKDNGQTFFAPPLRNVWLGVSVENQAEADKRIPALLRVPAKVRFLSCEPLLGPIDLNKEVCKKGDQGWVISQAVGDPQALWECRACGGTRYFETEPNIVWCPECKGTGIGVNWVIAGGESGHNARPCHPDWVRGLRDQCQAADVPFFFKQWGEWSWVNPDRASYEFSSPVEKCTTMGDMRFFRTGKKVSGSLVDGLEWKQFP